jgi:ribosomal protein S18 acetylase RimI-like enzyme
MATRADIAAWMVLAAGVEELFGPLVDQSDFGDALARNINRRSALCVRAQHEGAPLLAGGLLFSAHDPHYEIAWLAIDSRFRRLGIGRLLVRQALGTLAVPPCTVEVMTFAAGHPGSGAGAFYEQLGFSACAKESGDASRVVYQLELGRPFEEALS